MTTDLDKYKLIIFDLDDTLVSRYGTNFLPGVKNLLKAIPASTSVAIATNKGNVGLYYWMEEGGWGNLADSPQTPDEAEAQINEVQKNVEDLIGRSVALYKCYAFVSSKGNIAPIPKVVQESMIHGLIPSEWDINNRKPQPGMLLEAMADAGVEPHETLFIGDRDTDQEAAEMALCHFLHVDSILPSYKDSIVVRYNPNILRVIYEEATQDNGTVADVSSPVVFEEMVESALNRYYEIGKVELRRDYNLDQMTPVITSESDDISESTLQSFERELFLLAIGLEWVTFSSADDHLAALEAAKFTHVGQKWINAQAIMFGRIAESRYAACKHGDDAYNDYNDKGAEIFKSMPDLRVLALRNDIKTAFHGFFDILADIETHNPEIDTLWTGKGENDEAFANLIELAADLVGDELATELEERRKTIQANDVVDSGKVEPGFYSLADAQEMVDESNTHYDQTVRHVVESLRANIEEARTRDQLLTYLWVQNYAGKYGKEAVLGLRVAQLMGKLEDVAHDYYGNHNNKSFEPRTKDLAKPA